MNYAVQPIPPTVLTALRTRDDADNSVHPYDDPEGDAPLRCCLRDSEKGERIALITYAPLRRWATDPGAYDEQGPVFIHATPCEGPADTTTPAFTDNHRVLRRYSAEGHIMGGELVGEDFDGALRRAFEDEDVAQVHVRSVVYGCFLYAVERA
ncbi:DUF1203 domain-containing protein [Streptomyces acidiscabies]|uniref:DUF1203 domain-containing protein n=1 Tax=Streptomyces acidiscabies TaxID=42234 RepID=UPI00073F2620|nr:DUF1203 domain-containing protein [Streptomyces acidiscabies]GAQ56605.1 hypothetical protein a10_06461 [Streptomyces acidiscabies]